VDTIRSPEISPAREKLSLRKEYRTEDMEKRAIVAIVLTFLVIFLWGVIQSKFFPSQPKKEIRKEEVVAPEKKAEVKEVKPSKEEKPFAKPKVVPKKEVSVETQHYWATLSSEGAVVEHFKLKEFKDKVEESAITIKLTRFFQGLFGKEPKPPKEAEPLDLVNTEKGEGKPLELAANPPLSNGGWEVEKDQLRLLGSDEKGDVAFAKTFESGLKVIKRYRFTADKYAFNLELELQNQSSKEMTIQPGVEWIGKIELKKLAEEDNKDYGLKYAYLKDGKVERKDLAGSPSSGCTPGCGTTKTRIEPFENSVKGDIEWFAFEGEYFASLVAPPPPERNVTLEVKGDEKNFLEADVLTSPISLQPKESVKIPFQIYMGPKDEERLETVGAGKLLHFGFFTIVAKPLLWFLKLTHRVTGNYGIDIIILSILIKIIFLPLTQISFKSMKEMQKVQPEMARLKEIYKNDKARLQQEIMLLYKRRRINPMSGCLPMLIQIPVFIALYNALQNAIEMRHAPFFLWIKDLSAKDPIYITPLIMGATMVIQQKMTPTAADPAQAKLFMLMPVMFTFLFLNFPAGLVLYWLVNNVLSIAHQYYLNKR
jgi:YidC/Oxa1 family membrane protein insertase